MTSHYETLQVARSASDIVIRAAYKSLIQKWHPDKNAEKLSDANVRVQEINRAYAVLSDPELREAHDVFLESCEEMLRRPSSMHGSSTFSGPRVPNATQSTILNNQPSSTPTSNGAKETGATYGVQKEVTSNLVQASNAHRALLVVFGISVLLLFGGSIPLPIFVVQYFLIGLFAFFLAKAMRSSGILWGLVCAIPGVGFFGVLILLSKSYEFFRSNGMKVHFWGGATKIKSAAKIDKRAEATSWGLRIAVGLAAASILAAMLLPLYSRWKKEAVEDRLSTSQSTSAPIPASETTSIAADANVLPDLNQSHARLGSTAQIQQRQFDMMLSQLFFAVPYLDPSSPTYDKEKTDEVIARMMEYANAGYPKVISLQFAAKERTGYLLKIPTIAE